MEQPYTTFGSQEEDKGELMSDPLERTEKAVAQLQKMIDRLKSAGPGYTTDVIALHSLEDWMTQITIKATRARYARTVDKTRDELVDTANYCALALSLLEEAEQQVAKVSAKVVVVPPGDDVHG